MRTAVSLVASWLVVVAGCGPQPSTSPAFGTSPVASVPPTAPPAPSASATRVGPRAVDRVCADPTCGGPGAVVQQWRDAKGALARWEIVHSPTCFHLAGLFYDPEGQNRVLLPMPFLPPGTPSQQRSVQSMHDGEIAGLTAGAQSVCGP